MMVSELWEYSENVDTGLIWKIHVYAGPTGQILRASPGQRAGGSHYGPNGYESWAVQYKGQKYQVHRVIWELHYGPIADGLVIEHKDGNAKNNHISNLRAVSQVVNMRNLPKRKDNTSGTTGVARRTFKNGNPRWVASWYSLSGNKKSKSFSVYVYGDDLAELLAIEYRDKQIQLLNLAGAGYTEDHGTR